MKLCNAITQENETYETLTENLIKVYEQHKTNYLNFLTDKELNTLPQKTITEDFILFIKQTIKEYENKQPNKINKTNNNKQITNTYK